MVSVRETMSVVVDIGASSEGLIRSYTLFTNTPYGPWLLVDVGRDARAVPRTLSATLHTLGIAANPLLVTTRVQGYLAYKKPPPRRTLQVVTGASLGNTGYHLRNARVSGEGGGA